MSRLHVGIFGSGLSGKTTLAKGISKEAAKGGVNSLVLDPNQEVWGAQAKIFVDEDLFWNDVWHVSLNKLVFVEEAAETIRRDNKKTSLFTRIRHRGHKLVVIGHNGTNLLPVQREQIHHLYLFKQSPGAAELWADLWADERIMAATTLKQYEFLRCVLWGAAGGEGNLIVKNRLDF